MKSLYQRYKAVLSSHPKLKKAQSFVELALILPILIMILLGVVEISFMVSQYLDLLDLTREAARFASVRDPFDSTTPDYDCRVGTPFFFYYDTACVFSPPDGSASCIANDPFCNGVNPFVALDPAVDDVVISVFSVSDAGGTYEVKDAWPEPNGYWALSNISDPLHPKNNWTKDCQGNVVRTEPYYTIDTVTERLNSDANTPHSKGFVAVELYYCYHQVLKLALVFPDPLRLHAYTLMSLPAAAPTPTPRPSVGP
jgi:hypothetical protein